MNGVRLAYLVSQYPAISHTFVLREIRALRRSGLEIHVASINDPDRPLDELTPEEREEAEGTFYVKRRGAARAGLGLTLAFLAHPRRFGRGLASAVRLGGTDPKRILYGLFYFAEAVLIGRWMRSHRLDHLHVHFATPAATVGLIATHLFPITLSITVHGPDEFYDVRGHRLAEKVEGSAFLCCIGAYARSQLMRLSPIEQWSKLELAPLGVDPTEFAPRPSPNGNGAFEILCVGRLVPAKGQHVLVAAAERLVRAGRRVRVRLVGDGPDRTSLETDVEARGLREHVVFEGAVGQDRIRALYARAHVFVLPSFAEGIPVALMEAMAMEIPCVTTCIHGIPELIRDGIDGILVPPSDEEALSEAIVRLMDDPALCRKLGERGRRRVRESYDLERNVARLGEIFRRRLAAPDGGPS